MSTPYMPQPQQPPGAPVPRPAGPGYATAPAHAMGMQQPPPGMQQPPPGGMHMTSPPLASMPPAHAVGGSGGVVHAPPPGSVPSAGPPGWQQQQQPPLHSGGVPLARGPPPLGLAAGMPPAMPMPGHHHAAAAAAPSAAAAVMQPPPGTLATQPRPLLQPPLYATPQQQQQQPPAAQPPVPPLQQHLLQQPAAPPRPLAMPQQLPPQQQLQPPPLAGVPRPPMMQPMAPGAPPGAFAGAGGQHLAASAAPGYATAGYAGAPPGPPTGPPPPQQMLAGAHAGGAAPPGGFPGFPAAQPVPGGFDAYAGQRLVEQFESLMLSAGPGAPEADISAFPRPVGSEREAAAAPQPPYAPGNCSADNMRPTVMGVPNSTALRLRWQLPLGVIVRPMADEALGRDVPVIPLGSHGIVRCRRCRTYMNPFCTWVDGGRRFKCNVCAMLNEVPVEYYCTLDANGIRRDSPDRPELSCGTVEWVAPQEYMVRPPMPPVYVFAIDVSAAAYASGMVSIVAQTIRACLDKLPGDERTLVGFLTFDRALHFYNLKPALAAPQMLVVTELEDPFLPLPDDLLVNLRDSRPVIEALLDSLPGGYSSATSADSAMGAALQAAFLVMGHVGGKLLLFQAAQPTLGAGRLKPSRENLNLYGTDREASLRNPEDQFFKRFAGEASSRQITLDVFIGTNGYADLASLSSIPRYTCGQVHYFPSFHAQRDGARLTAELTRNLTRPTAWEAVMRIRCSRGLKIASFHGHFFNRSTDLLALPTCDPDKAFAVQIGHEETLVNGPAAYVQCALLHTSSSGERRIRVHTMALPVLSELSELYRAADGAATACLLAKLGVEKSLMAKLDDTRMALVTKLSSAFKEYRLLHGAHVRNPGALIYPSTLRYLPAHVLGLIKSAAFRGSGRDVGADERCAASFALMAATVDDTLRLAYPDVYLLTDAPGSTWGVQEQGKMVLPASVPASLAYIHTTSCYLLDNGHMLVLWLGRDVPPDWACQLLGPQAANAGVDPSTLPLEPARDSRLSQRLCSVLSFLRNRHAGGYAPAFAVRQGTPLEAHVVPLFVEDRGQGQQAYADFLQQLHRAVMNK